MFKMMIGVSVLLTFIVTLGTICSSQIDGRLKKFPEYFSFGVATSSIQGEGAWNVSGKGLSSWDVVGHYIPSQVSDGSNADDACKSYYHVKEDVALLKDLGVSHYRFSISWPRIYPNGYPIRPNPDGLRYYNELIDLLLENNIEPVVTMFHWEMPQTLQQMGGWTNEKIVQTYVLYADKLFEFFGDRVKIWATLNEPVYYCTTNLAVATPPYIENTAVASYLCAHNMLRAHAKIYHLYLTKYKSSQEGIIGITVDTSWLIAKDLESQEDQDAAERALQFYFGWFAHPIFSRNGDYPPLMRQRIDTVSKEQGFPESRLPYFTRREILELRGSYDYMGYNHYSTSLVTPGKEDAIENPGFNSDLNVTFLADPDWELTAGGLTYAVVPWGLRRALNWIQEQYGDFPIQIHENGYCGFRNETLNDDRRINFLNSYLEQVLKAINDGVHVTMYTYWGFMDDWEWQNGFDFKFGLYKVNFDDPKRSRVPKKSAYIYKNIIQTKQVDRKYNPDGFSDEC